MTKTMQHTKISVRSLQDGQHSPEEVTAEMARASSLLARVVARQTKRGNLFPTAKNYLKDQHELGYLGKSQTCIRLSGYIETLTYWVRMQSGIWIEGQTFD